MDVVSAPHGLQQQQGHWTLRVTRKGGGPQLVKVPADVYRALRAWLDTAGVREGALRCSVRRTGRGRAMVYQVGPALTADGILKIIQQRARRGGIPMLISPHALRATFITLALDGGAPLHKVQYAAGHGDPRTTERYHRTKINLDDHASDYIKLEDV